MWILSSRRPISEGEPYANFLCNNLDSCSEAISRDDSGGHERIDGDARNLVTPSSVVVD